MIERQIIVRDKNGTKIAVFSNASSTHTNESSKNLMVSPTISIVSNGESTLTFQMQADSAKWQQIKNPENLYYCNNRVYTALNEQSYVYNGPIVTVTLVELWYLLRYKFVQAHNVNTKVEAIDTHTVKILPKTKAQYKLTVNGRAYNDNQVKDSRGVIMPRGSAGYALWAILKGTDWTLGVCDVLPTGFNAAKDYGTFNVESDMKDCLENIELIQSLYGGILVWDSLHKILHLRDEEKSGSDFNTWKGFSIRRGKNISDYPEISWDNNLITRLYPLGNGNLNIAKVNNNKNYIDNFSYTNKVYEGYLQNENIYDTNDTGGQKALKFWAEKQVTKYCKPRKSISYSIVDVRGTEEHSYETFDINDIVKAYYIDSEDGKEKFEYLRIQTLEYNWFFPSSDSTIEVGDKINNATELFYEVYKDVQNSIATDSNGNISGDDVSIKIPEEYWEELFGSDYDAIGDGGYYADMNYITKLYAEHITENEEGIAYNKASVEVTADALQAQVLLEASHYSNNMESLAQVSATADENGAMIRLLTQTGDGRFAIIEQTQDYIKSQVGKANGNLSEIIQTADSISSKVSDASGDLSTIVQTAREIKSSVKSAAGYMSTISQTASKIQTEVLGSSGYLSKIEQTAKEIRTWVGKVEGSYSQILQTVGKIDLSVFDDFSDLTSHITISGGQVTIGSGTDSITVGRGVYFPGGFTANGSCKINSRLTVNNLTIGSGEINKKRFDTLKKTDLVLVSE